MKQIFVLPMVLLLVYSCDAAECPCRTEPPVLSPSSEPPMLSPSSAPSNNDCSTVIYGMMDCLSFLTVGSTDHSPTKSCCDGTKIVLEYNSSCLCIALESSRGMGFDLINSRALALPSTCNVPIDPHCDVASSPVASTPIAPTVSPSKPPTTSPSSSSPPARTTPTSPSSSSPPARTTPSPSVTPSPPEVRHSSYRTASPPTVAHSTPTVHAPSPAMIAPSPSKSGTRNLSVSKLSLVIILISSFVYVLD